VTHRTVRAVAVGVACSGLVAALLAPSIATAQSAPPKARDGRSLADESQAVQAQFQAAYGNNAGTQWQRLHNLTLRSDLPQAADGQSIRSAPADTQTAFIAIYGDDGPADWAIVHSGAIGKAIILTGDLEEAVDAAHDGDLNVARRDFKQFADAWENGFEPLIRPRSGDIADAVANQIRAVSAVLVTPQSPDKAKYSAALDELLDIANAQKVKLAALPAGAPLALVPPVVSAAPAAAVAGSGPHLATNIDTGELESSITGGLQNDITRARGELGEFFEAWNPVKADVQKENPQAYAEITADLEAARAALAVRPDPPASQYLPVEQKALATIRKWQGLASDTTAAAPGNAPAAAASTALKTIVNTDELQQSIASTVSNNLASASRNFGEFLDDWDKVSDAVKAENPAAYAEIQADIDAAKAAVSDDDATVVQVLPALQKALATIKKYQPTAANAG
jgi:hypothetical protein